MSITIISIVGSSYFAPFDLVWHGFMHHHRPRGSSVLSGGIDGNEMAHVHPVNGERDHMLPETNEFRCSDMSL